MRTRPAADNVHLRGLRQLFDEALAAALAGRNRAILLDLPAYRNAGDLLIARGTLDSLDRLGVRVHAIQDWTLTSWGTLSRLEDDVAVLLQGGGNFGGLYPEHDDYRGRVLRTVRHPGSVIVLPQSVNFPDHAAVQHSRDVYSGFSSATYLVRDSKSLDSLIEHIPELSGSVELCPDAAFGTTLETDGPPSSSVFVLQRHDAESTGKDLTKAITRIPAVNVAHGDWPSFEVELPAYRALRRMAATGVRLRRRAARLPEPLESVTVGALELAWRRPQAMTARAHINDHVGIIQATISQGRILVTDRLHGHIAASLMGVPNVVLNNSDGKVEALVREWTHPLSTTSFASSPSAAEARVSDLLSDAKH